MIYIDTTGLIPGMGYNCDIIISSNGGSGVFGVDIYIIYAPPSPIEQIIFDRGFPIRHAADGNWAGAQDFLPNIGTISKVEIYLEHQNLISWLNFEKEEFKEH
jgi:hypothetical protein